LDVRRRSGTGVGVGARSVNGAVATRERDSFMTSASVVARLSLMVQPGMIEWMHAQLATKVATRRREQ
jgi:hypothetical protein